MQSSAAMKRTRTAVILVAGVGARLRPLTDDRPKALMELGGETILGRAVRMLREHGVEHVVLATGYREDAVRAALADVPLRFTYRLNPRYDSTQNSVSLSACRPALSPDEAWFKLDGDVVFRAEVLERLADADAELTVAVDSRRSLDAEAMKVELGEGGSVLRFGKDVPLSRAGGESIGIERIAAGAGDRLFDALDRAMRAGFESHYYEQIYSELIAARQLTAQAVEVGDLPWTEVDTPSDLEHARRLVQGG
jgi:choline kinase